MTSEPIRSTSTEPPRAFAGPAGTPWWWVGAVSALVLLGVGLAVTARKGTWKPDLGGDGLLAAAVADLQAGSPTLFAGFTALDAAARAAKGPTPGEGSWLSVPRGLVTSERTDFSWRPVAGAKRYDFLLTDEQGKWLHARALLGETWFSYPADAPPLRPGATYTWKVSARATNGRNGRQSFRVASRAEQERFADGRAFIRQHAAPNLRDVLVVQWGIRQGFLSTAHRDAREANLRESRFYVLRETWRYLRRQLELDEGD